MPYARKLAVTLLLLSAIAGPPARAASTDPVPADPANVQMTQFGWVRGHHHAGVSRFLGIPYAAPPVDALRWQAPRDPESWQEVRNADRFGSACAQTGNFYASDEPHTFGQPYGSEDCLYLNVWTPAGAHDRPVLVFVHGGGGVLGAASLSAYEASRLSRELDAVVVSFNYRLSFFGGIDTPALHTGDPLSDSGNFLLLDQIKALDWVQRNIAAFGGDAGNVTVMGHSAGGTSVFAMLRSPLAAGKFSKAVILSAVPVSPKGDELTERTEKLLANLMHADGSIQNEDQLHERIRQLGSEGLRAYLYGKSTEELIRSAYKIPALGGRSDGVVLPAPNDDPTLDFPNAVPLLFGTVDNEAAMLLVQQYSKLDMHQLWDLMNSGRDDLQRSDLFTWFSYFKYRVASALFNHMARGLVADAADRMTQTGVPVYRYRFDWNEQPRPWRDLFGAYHGLDVPFLFGNFLTDHPAFGRFSWTPDTAAQREALHADLVAALKGFVEAGDPNTHVTRTKWPRWNDTGELAVIR